MCPCISVNHCMAIRQNIINRCAYKWAMTNGKSIVLGQNESHHINHDVFADAFHLTFWEMCIKIHAESKSWSRITSHHITQSSTSTLFAIWQHPYIYYFIFIVQEVLWSFLIMCIILFASWIVFRIWDLRRTGERQKVSIHNNSLHLDAWSQIDDFVLNTHWDYREFHRSFFIFPCSIPSELHTEFLWNIYELRKTYDLNVVSMFSKQGFEAFGDLYEFNLFTYILYKWCELQCACMDYKWSIEYIGVEKWLCRYTHTHNISFIHSKDNQIVYIINLL